MTDNFLSLSRVWIQPFGLAKSFGIAYNSPLNVVSEDKCPSPAEDGIFNRRGVACKDMAGWPLNRISQSCNIGKSDEHFEPRRRVAA